MRRPTQLLAVIVVAVLLAVILGGAYFTRQEVNGEEHRLLKERVSEVGLILTEAFTNLAATMQSIASETRFDDASPAGFEQAVRGGGPLPAGTAFGLAQVGPTSITFIDTAGPGLPAQASGPRAQAIRAALGAKAAASTGIFESGGIRYFGLASQVGLNNLVVYRESRINPTAATATTAAEPFHEMTVVLYSSSTPDPSQAIITTGRSTVLHGATAAEKVAFGQDTWLIVAKASGPLVGTIAARADVLVLGLGLVIVVAVGVLIVVLVRRRDYAVALVDERTAALSDRSAALSDSLAQLEVAQEQLVRQERLAAIGELASAVGHELRNPLGVITNTLFLSRAAVGAGDDERVLRQLATAEREVGAASLIVGDLLEFARARDPVMAPVDMHALVDEALGVAPPPARVQLTRTDGEKVEPADGDRDQIRQVLLNLVSNAYDAMPDGGELTIGVSMAGEMVEVTVADTGMGMDSETCDRLFEPFYTRKAKGIGLGLAVTRRIVEAHGGRISVQSTPGHGARFTLDLPAVDNAAASPTDGQATAPSSATAGRPNA
jgi:signal transduction histidine kinase